MRKSKEKVAPTHIYLISACLFAAGAVWLSLLLFPSNINSVSSHWPSFRGLTCLSLVPAVPERGSSTRVQLAINAGT